MSNSYMWSPSKLGFYPNSVLDLYKAAGSLPDDLIQVEDACYQEFASMPPPEGKTRGVGENNLPVWVDVSNATTSTSGAAG